MADNIEHQDKGEPVTNCDRLVAVDNIESLIKVIRGEYISKRIPLIALK